MSEWVGDSSLLQEGVGESETSKGSSDVASDEACRTDPDSDADPSSAIIVAAAPVDLVDGPPAPRCRIDDHTYVWLTRTNRKAKCVHCRSDIEPWAYRALFCPHPADVDDHRQWGKIWWKYYHLQCMKGAASADHLASGAGIKVDSMRRKEESPEFFTCAVDAAKVELSRVVRSE